MAPTVYNKRDGKNALGSIISRKTRIVNADSTEKNTIIREKGSAMPSLDDLDLALLAELEADARISVSELSRRLGAPSSTVRDRMRGLEESGVILGYTTVIDHEKLGLGIKAIIQVSRDQRFSLEDFEDEPVEFLEVTNVQLVTGEMDEFITVYADNVDHLKEIIYNKVGSLPGLDRSNTAIVLEEERFALTRRFLPGRKQE
jgi:DNA-binding Lrp family transcriptional regulator